MAMQANGTRGGLTAGINMTPMIDVLLVLLIIFMVVQIGLQRGIAVQVPPPDKDKTPSQDVSLVLQVEPGGRYALNRQPLDGAHLVDELRAVFDGRPRKVLFIQGAETLKYRDVVAALDASAAAGVEVIGMMPRQ